MMVLNPAMVTEDAAMVLVLAMVVLRSCSWFIISVSESSNSGSGSSIGAAMVSQ